MFSRT
jgi:hypothetical protein